jgi:hypothetical protein
MSTIADRLESLVRALSNTYLNSVTLMPASLQLELVKRDQSIEQVFVLSSNGWLSNDATIVPCESSSPQGAAELYKCIDTELKAVRRSADRVYALEFAGGRSVWFADEDANSDNVFLVRARNWPNRDEEGYYLLD